MHDHKALGFFGWVSWLLSFSVAFAANHWAVLISLGFGVISSVCHLRQTRYRKRELELKEIEHQRRRQRELLADSPDGMSELDRVKESFRRRHLGPGD
jgi:hypothetical protein